MWQQTPDEIRDWHRDVVDALVERHASILHAIRQGLTVASRFVGMTEAKVDAHYDAARRELDRLTVLNLVASAEGALKVDYHRRVDKKLKDPLSIAYRKWDETLSKKKKKKRPDFDEKGILDVLKKTRLIDDHLIGEYRKYLPARHWVGHGRYWRKPPVVDQLDPYDVYDRANALLQAMRAL